MSVKIIHHLVNVVVGCFVQEAKEKRRQRGDADLQERCVREKSKAITQMTDASGLHQSSLLFFFCQEKTFLKSGSGIKFNNVMMY